MLVKKRLNVWALLVKCLCLVALLAIIGLVSIEVFLLVYDDHYIFSDIRECDSLINVVDTDGEFVRYDDTSGDDYVADAEYQSFYAGKYKSVWLTFEIYAYDFATVSDAQQYYGRVIDTELPHDCTSAYSTIGSLDRTIVAIYETRAYTIYTSTIGEAILNVKLDEVFSLKIPV